MQYRIRRDGSFDISGSEISLTGCLPAVDRIPVKPVKIQSGSDSILYILPEGQLTIRFRTPEPGMLSAECTVDGLPGIRELDLMANAHTENVTRVFVQGFGMEGPSGYYEGKDETPVSYGISALCAKNSSLILFTEDHTRFISRFRIGNGELAGGFQLEGTAGNHLQLPPVFIRESGDPQTGLRACAGQIAAAMHARKTAGPAFFWSSWYYRYETMDQQTLEAYLAGFRETPGLPFRYIELDAGYCPHIGDWLTPNHRWPGGLRQAADTIRENGFLPGIWIAPFIIGDHSEVYRNHPDWILRDRNGDPVIMLRSYTEPKQWGNSDCNYFVLDASHPDAFAWLTEVFTTLYAWGFRFFKTDFMLWNMHDSADVKRYDPTVTSVEVIRKVLGMVRGIIGEDSYLLTCIAPFMACIGYADGMRIAADCGARWAEPFGPVNLLQELPADSYFNHIFWQNDPDAMIIRDFDTFLTDTEVQSLVLMQALSGGAVSTSDPVHLMSESRKELLRFVIPHGVHTPEILTDPEDPALLILLHRLPQGNILFVLNRGQDVLTYKTSLPALFGPETRYVYSYSSEAGSETASVPETDLSCELQAHECALYFITEKALTRRPENLWLWG